MKRIEPQPSGHPGRGFRPDGRPHPPAELLDFSRIDWFAPAPELATWSRATFIDETAKLLNEDHAHLRAADIAFLWTSAGNSRHGRAIVGQCEMGQPRGATGKWAKARVAQQLMEWFGRIPDFLITIDAHYASQADDASFCALIEHELYHAAQERDEFGAPKFRRSGLPVFGMRGHDVEEFVGVVRRYGSEAAGVKGLVDAAKHRPEVSRAGIAHACGTCQLKVA